MKRMTTKMSTVTPVTKSTGSGVANMGKKSKGLSMAQNKKKSPSRLSSVEAAKEMSSTKSKMPKTGMSMAMNTAKKAASEGANEGAQNFTKLKLSLAEKRANNKKMSMQMGTGAAAGAGMPRFAMKKTVSKVGSGPASPKAKAKMLPEVTVTAPKPKKRLALKVTSKRMR
jgi:hypothetical protein